MSPGFWTVACVASGQEFLFRNRLVEQQAGVGAYVPSRRTMIEGTRRSRKPREVVHPAFARYIFLHFDIAYLHQATLDATRIDYRLMIANERFMIIRDREIARVREGELLGDLDKMPKDAALDFSEGGLIRIVGGAFEGQTAPIIETPRAWAKEIYVSIGGCRARMPIEYCEAA